MSTIAKPTFRSLPRALALSVPPTSGATQIIFLLLIRFFACLANIGVEKGYLLEYQKNLVFVLHVGQQITTLSAPAFVIKFETSLAEIEVLGTTFLSCLAYPKYGMTAVIFFADDLFRASIQSNNSIRVIICRR